MRKKGHMLQNLALISYIGIAMMVPIIAGVAAGRWLDDRFNTSPALLFVFIVFGVLVGARNVYQLATKDIDRSGRK